MKLDRVTASTSSVEAEQGMLGAILNNNDLFHDVSAILRADFFSEPLHGAIWSNISARIERDHMASVVSLSADFADNETLMALGAMDTSHGWRLLPARLSRCGNMPC